MVCMSVPVTRCYFKWPLPSRVRAAQPPGVLTSSSWELSLAQLLQQEPARRAGRPLSPCPRCLLPASDTDPRAVLTQVGVKSRQGDCSGVPGHGGVWPLPQWCCMVGTCDPVAVQGVGAGPPGAVLPVPMPPARPDGPRYLPGVWADRASPLAPACSPARCSQAQYKVNGRREKVNCNLNTAARGGKGWA